jgi:hypothetical protein
MLSKISKLDRAGIRIAGIVGRVSGRSLVLVCPRNPIPRAYVVFPKLIVIIPPRIVQESEKVRI